MLNTWVSEAEICIAEKGIDDKTNEPTVLPKALAMVWLTWTLVTVDAMETHRSIAEQILMQGGDCLMALKENQPILRNLVGNMFKVGKPLSVNASEENTEYLAMVFNKS